MRQRLRQSAGVTGSRELLGIELESSDGAVCLPFNYFTSSVARVLGLVFGLVLFDTGSFCTALTGLEFTL